MMSNTMWIKVILAIWTLTIIWDIARPYGTEPHNQWHNGLHLRTFPACTYNNSDSYCGYIKSLRSWFDNSFLDLNVTKTKELCLGVSGWVSNTGVNHTYKPIRMKGQEVEQVTHFTYLRKITDNPLTFLDNIDTIYKKAKQCLNISSEKELQHQPAHPDHGLQIISWKCPPM